MRKIIYLISVAEALFKKTSDGRISAIDDDDLKSIELDKRTVQVRTLKYRRTLSYKELRYVYDSSVYQENEKRVAEYFKLRADILIYNGDEADAAKDRYKLWIADHSEWFTKRRKEELDFLWRDFLGGESDSD